MVKLNPEIYQRKMLFDQLYQSVHGELAEQLAKMCLGTSSLMALVSWRPSDMAILLVRTKKWQS